MKKQAPKPKKKIQTKSKPSKELDYFERLARQEEEDDTEPFPPFTDDEGDILRDVEQELRRATSLHGPMKSAHEGWAVLYEEVDELWEEIRKKKPDKQRMREEAIQIAAMAARFVMDVIK